MCDSKPSPEMTTRFCISVEQMVPYLENLCKVDEEDDDEDENENGIDVGDNLFENNGNGNEPPIPIEESVPDEIVPQITDDALNYTDISMLNPIVEAYACMQKDELNEEGMFDNTMLLVCRQLYQKNVTVKLLNFFIILHLTTS